MDAGLTDGQIGALLTVLGTGCAGIAAAIRISFWIWRDSQKDSRELYAKVVSDCNVTIRDNTAAFAKLTEWLGRVDARTEDAHGRVVEVHQEISGVHEAPDIVGGQRASTSVIVSDVDGGDRGQARIAKGSGGHGGGIVLSPTNTDDDETPVERSTPIARTKTRPVGGYHQKKDR